MVSIPHRMHQPGGMTLIHVTSQISDSPSLLSPSKHTITKAYRRTTPRSTRLVRPSLRRQVILVGGAASIIHFSCQYTEDLNVAAPPEAIQDIWRGVTDGAFEFKHESDGKIRWNAKQEFQIKTDLLEVGADPIHRIREAEPLSNGSVASMSDLLLLRAVTVVDREGDGDLLDFEWLLSKVVEIGNFPEIDNEELEIFVEAAEKCLGRLDCLVVAAFIGSRNIEAAFELLDNVL